MCVCACMCACGGGGDKRIAAAYLSTSCDLQLSTPPALKHLVSDQFKVVTDNLPTASLS